MSLEQLYYIPHHIASKQKNYNSRCIPSDIKCNCHQSTRNYLNKLNKRYLRTCRNQIHKDTLNHWGPLHRWSWQYSIRFGCTPGSLEDMDNKLDCYQGLGNTSSSKLCILSDLYTRIVCNLVDTICIHLDKQRRITNKLYNIDHLVCKMCIHKDNSSIRRHCQRSKCRIVSSRLNFSIVNNSEDNCLRIFLTYLDTVRTDRYCNMSSCHNKDIQEGKVRS